eukprot:703775-Pelagomonas_calceolata.AAC.1
MVLPESSNIHSQDFQLAHEFFHWRVELSIIVTTVAHLGDGQMDCVLQLSSEGDAEGGADVGKELSAKCSSEAGFSPSHTLPLCKVKMLPWRPHQSVSERRGFGVVIVGIQEVPDI